MPAPAPSGASARAPTVPADQPADTRPVPSPAITDLPAPEAPAAPSEPPPPVAVADATGPAATVPEAARVVATPGAPAQVAPVPVQSAADAPRVAVADPAPAVDAAAPAPVPVPAPATAATQPAPPAAPEATVAQADTPPQPAPEVRINRPPATADATPSDPMLPQPAAPEAGAATSEAAPAPVLPGQRASTMPGQRVPAPATGAAPSGATAEAAPAATTGVAIDDHAIAFANPDARPVLSIVLTETADGARPDPARMSGFPFPLTVALDPTRPDAAQALADYREAGVEAAMLVRLPEDASAQDVAVALEVYRSALPQTVAFVDGTDGALQSRREAMAQVVAELARSGHGFLTASQGFNAGQKLAAREGVPNGLILRALDPSDPGAMARALDAGALRAGQDGRAILTAPLTDASLAELAAWALGTRQAVITMAPLSAALDRGE